MKKTNSVSFLCITIGFVLFCSSCSTLMKGVSASAQVAGAFGIIDGSTANAISKSSESIALASEEITPQQEYYIGRAVGASILSSYRPFYDTAMTAYLNKICLSITANSPRPFIYKGYYVMILNSADINAFATSGGHIFITRGLLQCTDSEDALAAIIAHEIAHIQLQHSIKAIKTSRVSQALTTTTINIIASQANIPELAALFDESISHIVHTLVNSGYSQTQEFDADKTAIILLAETGYNPHAMLDMLTLLQKNQTGTVSLGFDKTHPSPSSRISEAEKILVSYPITTIPESRRIRFANTWANHK